MIERNKTPQDLAGRTKRFALHIVRLYASLPKKTEAQIIGHQILRAGTSVGARYREATQARSNTEFRSKLESGLQELEGTAYWLELLGESGIVRHEQLANLLAEVNELAAIFLTCIKTGGVGKAR